KRPSINFDTRPFFFVPACESTLAKLTASQHNHYNGLIQMLRKLTGLPWSCNAIGPAPCALYFGRPMYSVGPSSSTLFCTSTPLCNTVTRALLTRMPSALNRGAVQMMSYVCHSPGALVAFTSGIRCL